ncbi:hypothetical protein [Geodermatophilus sp. TF02-6]|uniref:hypothetical protein n=1 Tax=Geodermatophilus sp. TF02-6 TaxID=2250575 RepID=UPI0018F37F89|nr:hypothetical protein [Geodermatophilus sp. TF02-6]
MDVGVAWSQAAPSTAEENASIEEHGHAHWGAWPLAADPDASEDTGKRYAFPYGDLHRVDRAALIHAEQRAAQNYHPEVVDAARDLLRRLDDRRG